MSLALRAKCLAEGAIGQGGDLENKPRSTCMRVVRSRLTQKQADKLVGR